MNTDGERLDRAIDTIKAAAAGWEPDGAGYVLARLREAARLQQASPVQLPARRGRALWGVAAAIAVAAIALTVWVTVPGEAAVIGLRGELLGPNGRLAVGAAVPDGVPLRTRPDADAMLRLGDGSVLEMAGGSAAQLARGWRGETVTVERGRVLVEAAKQGFLRHLYVATADCRVAVVGTIFEVDRTPAGSRVSVVDGVVSVATPHHRRRLTAGEQAVSAAAVGRMPVGAAVAWSRNAPFYWAMLDYVPPSPAPPPPAPVPAPASAPPPAPPQTAVQAPVAPLSVHPAPVRRMPTQLQQTAKPAAAAKKPAPPPDPLLVLFQQAENAIADVPAEAQPDDLLDLAEAEDVRHPNLGRATVVRAFHAALDLSPPRSDDARGQWHAVIKANAELRAMTLLKRRPQDFATAHSLARIADTRRGPLYTELISAALTAARAKAGAGMPLEQGLLARMNGGLGFQFKRIRPIQGIEPHYDVLALANECYQADGSFPYLGVAIALSAYRSAGSDQRPLLMAAYRAVAGETDLSGMDEAMSVLQAGRLVYPDLDSQWEDAAVSLLRHLNHGVHNPPTGGIRAHQQYIAELVHAGIVDGNVLLSLLARVDPQRASELRVQYAEFSANETHKPIPLSALTARQRRANADPSAALTTANAMPSISGQQKTAKFLALAHLAVVLAQPNPGPATQAASEAQDMLTAKMIAGHVDVVGLLALRMATDLNEPDQAEALMTRALDAAESVAEAKEQAFDNAGDAASRRTLSEDFDGVGAPEVRVFAYAALLDPVLAEQRAEQTGATDFKPLFLIRVAVGEEMKRPWWNR